MEVLFSILRFIGVLILVLMMFNIMIVVHEWGHFLAGRWRGLYIDRFQIWFGKPIWKKTYNGVQYGLGSIPAGGFVSLPQMAPMESIEGGVEGDVPLKKLPPITPLDKIIVAFAGPLFSFLLAVVFAVVVWAVKKPVSEAVGTTTIGYVAEESPAAKAGIQVGDTIQSIDGKKVERFLGMNKSIMWTVISSDNKDIDVELDRPGTGLVKLTVVRPEEAQEGKLEGGWLRQTWEYVSRRPALRMIGVAPMISPVVASLSENSPALAAGFRKGDLILSIDGKAVRSTDDVSSYPWEAGRVHEIGVRRDKSEITLTVTPRVPEKHGEKPLLGIAMSHDGIRTLVRENPVVQVIDSFNSIVRTLSAVFSPTSDVKAGHLSGPVGIMGTYYDLFKDPEGWRLALWFSVLLNVNLAILNLLPFPVLDGGHIVMASYEWLTRRAIPIRFLEVVQTAFVLLLLFFMGFVTLKDVGDRIPNGEPVEQKPRPEFLPLEQ
ncbi:MAG: RIP metalloprotease RseP [Verrucomicrobiaceae bacterium]|nr:RIP metalloprotease RseP [Verrucomicrobiaceae bacterium]